MSCSAVSWSSRTTIARVNDPEVSFHTILFYVRPSTTAAIIAAAVKMATYDNKYWLLSHIRNSFISTDDTRMCEIVMAGENFPKLLYARAQERRVALGETTGAGDVGSGSPSEYREPISEYDPYPEMEESEDDLDMLNGSYIRHEDFGPYRQRSNTAQWIEKKELAMKKAAKIKVIKWEDPPSQLTDEERVNIFTKKDLTNTQNTTKKRNMRSLLTEQLEQCPHLPHRQYLEYAKFDGTAQLGLPTKTFKIFMTMLPEDHQNYPITVCVIASAKIQDLIGFTCYKYSIQFPEITLGPANTYGLCIAEDDGEVDWTFPCLDSNEPCSKFGFTCLGLVELKSKNAQNHITSSIPEDGTLIGAFPMQYPKHSEAGLTRHQTESRNNTGGSGISDAAIRAFHAVHPEKKISLPSPQDHDLDKINSHILASEAPQYKSYNVQLCNKVRSNTSVQLGISLERIDIEPQPSISHKFWSRTKHVSYSIDSVAWCQIVEAKANKTIFRLVHSAGHSSSLPQTTGNTGFLQAGTNFKHHYFECDHETAKEIVEKINRILELRNSPCRRDYKAAKDRKLQTRRSFHTPKS